MADLTLDEIKARCLVKDDGCWLWQGLISRGYPLYFGKRAHRLAYEQARGPIREVLHHLCENPSCCNPEHLVDMSQSEHRHLHGGNDGKWCFRGNHPFVAIPTGGCRTCDRAKRAERAGARFSRHG